MYVEELAIERYYNAMQQWRMLSEEEQFETPEPEKPMVLILREQEEFENPPLAPDIMDMIGWE